jgi:hypothetical protein
LAINFAGIAAGAFGKPFFGYSAEREFSLVAVRHRTVPSFAAVISGIFAKCSRAFGVAFALISLGQAGSGRSVKGKSASAANRSDAASYLQLCVQIADEMKASGSPGTICARVERFDGFFGSPMSL